MFALLDLSEDSRGISLKCDPELAIELREQRHEVTPAWHFNKVIWQALEHVVRRHFDKGVAGDLKQPFAEIFRSEFTHGII